MKTLQDVQNTAMDMMEEHGLLDKGWYFDWNRRTTSVGLCNHNKYSISLSKVMTPHRKPSDIRNTILHEIAHALVGHSNGHNRVWREKFIEIGGNGEVGAVDIKDPMIGVKWVLKSPDGTIYKYYSRRPNRKTLDAVNRLYPSGQKYLKGSLKFVRVGDE
jgi:hypothetical protein